MLGFIKKILGLTDPKVGPVQQDIDLAEDQLWHITTVQWPDNYIYHQNTSDGNCRGYAGEPGPQGQFKFKKLDNGYYRISTKEWPDNFTYMQDYEDGNVRSWSEKQNK